MPPPNIVELTELPHELLMQIINPLDDESICALAKTCRHLHFFALPLFLSRHGVRTLPPNCVSITCPSKKALSVLWASLFMENIKKIQFHTIDEDADRLLSDICSLRRLFARLPSFCSLPLIYSTHGFIENSALHNPAFDMRKWSAELSALLDTAIQKSCQSLYIFGTDDVSTSCSSRPDPQEQLATKVGKVLPGKASRKLFSFFSRAKIPPDPPRTQLNDFIIASSMLLQTQFFRWTLSTLQANAATVTQLKFNKAIANSSTWHQLLSTLALPLLFSFELIADGQLVEGKNVDLRDVEVFLTRHPSILILNISGIPIPDLVPQFQNPILPRLCYIEAHPKFIAWLLHYHLAHFQTLKVVTITTESSDFGYNKYDEALEAISLSYVNIAQLSLNFVSNNGHEWMQKHISSSMTPLRSIITHLSRITSLTIQTNYWMMLDDRDDPMVQLLPQFLALFSSLEKVNFNQQLCATQRANLKGCKDIFKKILSACPRVKTILINSAVIDLAFLEV
ncbi:hypothetical protein K443DRAFT_115855 [Laccaria amethystina LaAM-08-1]|uniref:F-box domain-containing protein n=1 Tax=Laccaria amethystina LaAM-08-1 TaxID=1095629 RepID=A0A0C9WSG4_9AGAR|nr:hypothetical protein K443DRAFT_115855 [Laccaria amethystina LaAM-08-1]